MDRVRRRIQDHKVLRLVLAFLKADIMIEGCLRHPVTGTPQGGIISPMRSNIFLHHVLDKWFEDVVRPRRRGKATLVRFADDFVMTFETHTMPSWSWTCWGSGLAGSASRCIRTRRASSTSARSVMVGRPQTARLNRSTSLASPTRGKSRGRARTWCGEQRPKPLRPLAGRGQGMVPDQPASACTRTARLAVCGTQWSLCLLWHHGKHSADPGVSLPS